MQTKQTDVPVSAGNDVADVRDSAGIESGTGGRDQSADERAVYYHDLVSLIREHGAKLEKNERVYSVQYGFEPVYVVSNSPAGAALAVCDVHRVADKELVKAAFEAMGVK